MRRFGFTFLSVMVMLARGTAMAAEDPPPVDEATGMKIAENWQLVRDHCIICHSPQTFLRQRGTEATWTAILEWMQTSGGLWKLDPTIEKSIIQYLTAHYGPSGAHFRRAPIPATLMPPNPYASDAKLEAEAKKKQGLVPAGPPAAKP